jgi:hypothetical protein
MRTYFSALPSACPCIDETRLENIKLEGARIIVPTDDLDSFLVHCSNELIGKCLQLLLVTILLSLACHFHHWFIHHPPVPRPSLIRCGRTISIMYIYVFTSGSVRPMYSLNFSIAVASWMSGFKKSCASMAYFLGSEVCFSM